MKWFEGTFPRKRIDPKLRGFTIFVVILCLLNLLINNINHRFFVSDFKVYYYAAQDLLQGGKVYFIAFGLDSGFFKYSPMNLLLFVPYQALSFTAAAVVHLAILSFCYWYTYILINKFLKEFYFPGIRRQGWLLTFAVMGTMIFLVKELYLGNINIVLIVLSMMSLDFLLRGKPWMSGVLLGLVIFTKPFFLILVLPLFFRKKYRAIVGMGVVMITALILPFIIL
jgi:arabinofuranan 3-O-arabinosyltransferase